MRRTSALLVAASLAVLSGVLISPSDASTRTQPCEALGVAPDESLSGHLICLSVETQSVDGEETSHKLDVWSSANRGRSWTLRNGLGLPAVPSEWAPPPPSGGFGFLGSTPVQAFYSLGYATDRTIYVAVSASASGLFRSTDDGDTWTLAAPLTSTEVGIFTPYQDNSPLPTGGENTTYPIADTSQIYVTGPDGSTLSPPGPLRIDPPATVPAKGAGNAWDQVFTFSPGPYRGISMMSNAWKPGTGSGDFDVFTNGSSSLRSCTPSLDCSTVLHQFPRGLALGRPALAGDFDRTGRVYLQTDQETAGGVIGMTFKVGFVQSDDGGRHFNTPAWYSALAAKYHVVGGYVSAAPMTSPARPHEVVIALGLACTTSACHSDTMPGYLVSNDDGRTWTSIWSAAAEKQKVAAAYQMLAPDGRLFAVAAEANTYPTIPAFPNTNTFFCSTDNGRTWASPCSR